MHPSLWLLWAILAIAILFIGLAVVVVVVERLRTGPPKRCPHELHIEPFVAPPTQRTYGEAIDHKRHGRQQ